MRWLKLFVLLAITNGCECGGDTRLQSRALVSGQVVLSSINGLNDMSRVRVELGRGEGGATPDETGAFVFSDIEADVYPLVITYSGGLNADADQSAYQRYELDVIAKKGGSVNLGRIELELGTGSIAGLVELPDGILAGDVLLRLQERETAQIFETRPDTDGNYEFTNVPVGNYRLTATGLFSSLCQPEDVPVSWHGEAIEQPTFEVYTLAFTVEPTADQARVSGNEWYVNNEPQGRDSVALLLNAPYASGTRMWFESQTPPDYSAAASALTIEPIPEGRTAVYLQVQDSCGRESDPYQWFLIRDTEPPVGGLVLINNGSPYTVSTNVQVLLSATDHVSGVQWMKISEDQTFADRPNWETFVGQYSWEFADIQGVKTLYVKYRDGALNESAVSSDEIVLDNVTPQNVALAINHNDSLTTSGVVLLSLDGDDAVEMQISNSATFAGALWQTYMPTVNAWPLQEPDSDGTKVVYARFRDIALNVSDIAQDDIELKTTGTLTGTIVVTGPSSPSGATLLLDDATVANVVIDSASGAFTIEDVPQGMHRLTAIIDDNYTSPANLSVSVFAAETADVGQLQLSYRWGTMSGSVALEASSDCSGVELSLKGVTLSTASWNGCEFQAASIEVGHYAGLLVSATGFTPTRSDYFEISPDANTAVGTITAARATGIASGQVRLQGQSDHVGILVEFFPVGADSDQRPSYRTLTQGGGNFLQPGMWHGSYQVRASKEGYSMADLGVILVQAGEETDVTQAGAVILSEQVGDFVIKDPLGRSGYTSQTAVHLELAFEDVDAFRWSLEGGSFSDWVPWSDPDSDGTMVHGEGGQVVIGYGSGQAPGEDDGVKTILIETRDTNQVPSGIPYYQSSIVLDTVAPVNGSITLNGGDQYTNTTTGQVLATAMAEDTSGIAYIWVSDQPRTGPEQFVSQQRRLFSAQFGWDLPSADVDGEKAIWAMFEDPAGNYSQVVSSSIVLDTQAPQVLQLQVISQGVACVTPPCLVNARDAWLRVVEDFNATTGFSDIRQVWTTRDDPSFHTGLWRDYAPLGGHNYGDIYIELPAIDGVFTYYLQAVDAAGNVVGDVEANRLSIDIQLDTTPPVLPVVTAPAYVNGAVVAVDFGNLSDVASILGSWSPDFEPTVTHPPNARVEFALPSADDGLYTLRLRYVDAAGNPGPVRSLVVTRDSQPPSDADIQIRLASPSNATSAQLDLFCIGADLMRVSADADCTQPGTGWDPQQLGNWVPYATGAVMPLSGQGQKDFSVIYRDLAGNLSACLTDAVVRDTQPPQVTAVNITGPNVKQPGAVRYASAPQVILALSADETIDWVRMTNAAAFSDEPMVPFAAEVAWVLDNSVDGLKQVLVQFYDAAGNAATATASVTLDTTAPTLSEFFLEGGVDTYSQDRDVSLVVSTYDADPDGYQLLLWGDVSGAPVSFDWSAIPATVALSQMNASNVVYASLQDAAGHRSPVLEATVTTDDSAPTVATPAVLLNNGDTYATSEIVQVDFFVTGASEMRVACDGELNAETWVPFVGGMTCNVGGANGTSKSVQAVFRDAAGNETSLQQDAITVDDVAPTNCGVTIAGGVTHTNTAGLNVEYFCGDAVEVYLGGDIADIGPIAYTAGTWQQSAVSLQGADGEKRVDVTFWDAAGNSSAPVSDTIVLDTLAPQLSGITIRGYNKDGTPNYSSTATTDITVELNGASGATLVATSTDTLDCDSASYTQPFVLELPASVTAAGQISLCLRDAAGNTVGPETASIAVDTTPPSCSIVIRGFYADDTGLTNPLDDVGALTTVEMTSSCSAPLPQAMAVVAGEDFLDCATASYTSFSERTLATVSSGDGDKNLKVCFRDDVGNYTASPVSATTDNDIALDQTPPSGNSLFVARSGESTAATHVATTGVSVFLGSNDAQDMVFSRSSDMSSGGGGGSWSGYSTAAQSLTLVSGSGCAAADGEERRTYAQFRDAMHNVSEVVSYSVILDTCAPEAPTVYMHESSGAASTEYTNSRDVVTEVTNQATVFAHATKMRIGSSEDGSGCPAAEDMVSYSLVPTFVLSFSTDDLKDGCVVLEDAAGNLGPVGSDTITVDTVAPGSPMLSPGNVQNANASCARITPSGVTLSDVYKWQARSNGGSWGDFASGVSNIEFNLIQDSDNLLEIRAVDYAGNIGQANVAQIEEVSTQYVSTALTATRVCGDYNDPDEQFVLLKNVEDRAYPAFWSGADISPQYSGFNLAREMALLRLRPLEYLQYSGPGGLLSSMLGTHSWAYKYTGDAICNTMKPSIAFSFMAGTTNDDFYIAVHNNPFYEREIGNSMNPLAIAGPLKYTTTGRFMVTFNSAPAQLDAIRWAHGDETSNGFEILYVDTKQWAAENSYYEYLRRVTYDSMGNATVTVPSTINNNMTPGTNRLHGLGFDGNDVLYLQFDVNSGVEDWTVMRTSSMSSVGSPIYVGADPVQYIFSGTMGGMQHTWSAYNTVVRPMQFNEPWFGANYVGALFYFPGSGDSCNIHYRDAGETSNQTWGTNGPSCGGTGRLDVVGHMQIEHADAGFTHRVGWASSSQDQTFILDEDYNTETPMVEKYTYRIDRNRPILTMSQAGAGEPFLVFHDKDSGGVVIGYLNEASCVQ